MVGQFKDDRVQTHQHAQSGYMVTSSQSVYLPLYSGAGYSIAQSTNQTGNNTGRVGDTTRGKRKGVKFIIKVL